MEFMVNCVVVLSLLLSEWTLSVQAEIFNHITAQWRDIVLHCENEGKVIWEQGFDRGRSTILWAENGEIRKYRPDPENRYSVTDDLSLLIRNVNFSDSGIYYCNAVPVLKLIVSPPLTVSQTATQGGDVVLDCENKGTVVWEQRSDRRSIILWAENGKITQKSRSDPENRYSVTDNSSLLIRNVTLSDSGIYCCNNVPVVNLTVNHLLTEYPIPQSPYDPLTTSSSTIPATGGVSVVESVLMFGGVGLAALMFLLATVAAGRVIIQQVWQAGWTAGKQAAQLSPSE